MSTFQVLVVPISIEVHPDADALELAAIGGYRAVVRKGAFTEGQLCAYIPEQAILPAALLEELGLVGRLGGSQKNRVTAVRLRGVLSQGIVMAARPHWVEGQDVQEELGITKYEPPIPAHMNGRVTGAHFHNTLPYDIENIKKFPNLFQEGEPVVITEKLHGTWVQISLLPAAEADPGGRTLISSKGLASRGQAFDLTDPEADQNLYVRTAATHRVADRLLAVFGERDEPVTLLGEVFGQGVQDLHYGEHARSSEAPPGLRVFDIYLGRRGSGRVLGDAELDAARFYRGVPRVPVLYRGPFSPPVVATLTDGAETLSGKALHLREGVVIRNQHERQDRRAGRVQLKSVSAAYLLRKGGTELQ